MIIPDNIKSIDVFNPYKNHEVVDFYCAVICKALRSIGYKVMYINQLEKRGDNRDKAIFVVKVSDARAAKMSKYGYIMTWIQGIAPEEKWLITRSPLRFINAIRHESLGLLSSDFNIYCSECMKSHYLKHYMVRAKQDFIMPCFNEEIDLRAIQNKDYSNNIFSYSGGMDRWQCFDQTVKIYKQIEDKVPNTFFKVFARDKELAKEILERNHVRNYSIDYVSQEQLKKEYKDIKFGFCIRDDIEINRVATPTKLSGYVANGIIPIYSKCIESFAKQSEEFRYALCVDDPNFIDQVESLCYEKLVNTQVSENFLNCYGNYYSADYYIEKLIKLLKG